MNALFPTPVNQSNDSFNLSSILQTVFVVTVVPLVLQSGNNIIKFLFDKLYEWGFYIWNFKANRSVIRHIPMYWTNNFVTDMFDAIEQYLDDINKSPEKLKMMTNCFSTILEVNYFSSFGKMKFRPKTGSTFRFFVDYSKDFQLCSQKSNNQNILEISINLMSVEQKQTSSNSPNSPNFVNSNDNKKDEKYYQVKLIGSNDGKKLDEFLKHVVNLKLHKNHQLYKVTSLLSSFPDVLNVNEKNNNLDGILMNDDLRTSIRNDIKLFWDDENHYVKISQPHRMSFFLVGKPGCGKTSFIRCLPSEIEGEVNVIILKFPSKSNNMMYDINNIFEKAKYSTINNQSKKTIWVIEDVDCISSAFGKRDSEDPERQKQAAGLSALLNAIDGIETPEHLMIIFTSNFPDSIDPAIVRPGRMDKIYNFDHIRDKQTLIDYGKKFFSDVDNDLMPPDEFYQRLLDNKLTNASIVQIMKRYRNFCKINKRVCDWAKIINEFIDERTNNNLEQSIFIDLPKLHNFNVIDI